MTEQTAEYILKKEVEAAKDALSDYLSQNFRAGLLYFMIPDYYSEIIFNGALILGSNLSVEEIPTSITLDEFITNIVTNDSKFLGILPVDDKADEMIEAAIKKIKEPKLDVIIHDNFNGYHAKIYEIKKNQ